MSAARKGKAHVSLARFNEGTLDRLVESALARVHDLEADLKTEGLVIATEGGGRANPKIAILQAEREWIRKAWSTKYQGTDGKKENYFADGPKA